jgi:hypothetical protein
MKRQQLPQHVSAVSPIGDALDGTGTGSVPYSVPHTNGNGTAPAQPPPVWECRAKRCSSKFPREQAERITEHLRMHLDAAGPRSSVPLTVTPELCEWWLANTKRRRPISEGNWRRILLDIQSGDWVFDGNPFGLDTEGNLIQGGHRATAVAAAGTDVESALIGDLAPGAALTMDTSMVQTFQHVLTATGAPNAADAASATLMLWRYEHGQLDPKLSWNKRVKPSNPQLMHLYEAKETEIRAALTVARPVRRVVKFASQPAMAVAYIAISRVQPGEAAGFFDSLALRGSHAPLHGTRDPIAAWHRKWGHQSPHDKLRPEEQAALTIKCWNFLVRGMPITQLKWRNVGPSPESFPEPAPLSLAARDDPDLPPQD